MTDSERSKSSEGEGKDKQGAADSSAMTNVLYVAFGLPAPFPRIRLRDLSPQMEAMVGRHVVSMLAENDRRGGKVSESHVYLAAIEHFGIECPHVTKENSEYARCRGFVLECRHCGTVICAASATHAAPSNEHSERNKS